MKMNFDYFQIKKSMLQTVRAEKAAEKKKEWGWGWGHLSIFHATFLSYGH